MKSKRISAKLQVELDAAHKKAAGQILSLPNSDQVSAEDEAFFSRVFQISPAPMALSEVESTKYIEVNEAFLRAFGYTREEVIGRTHLELNLFIDPSQRTQLIDNMKVQRHLRGVHMELRAKTGEIRSGIFSAEFVQLGSKELLLVVMNDVTETRLAEEALQKSELRFSTIFENSPIAIIISRLRDMEIVHVNPAFAELFGAAREEIIGHTTEGLGIWAIQDDRANFLQLAQTQKRVSGLETVARDYSGRLRNVIISGEIIEIDNDPCFVAQVIDITERKQGEDALRKSELRFLTIFKNSPVAIAISRLEDKKILHFNKAFLDQYGFGSEDVLGHTTEELGIWAKSEERVRFIEMLQTQKMVSGFEATARPSNGEERNVIVSGEMMEIDGELCLVAQITDITERIKADAALRASETNYRNLVENSESAIAVVDRDGKIMFINLKGIDLWQDKGMVGKSIYDLFPPEYADRYSHAIRSVIDTQIGILDEVESIVAGRVMWFRLSMTPLKNPDDTISSLLVNAWDITDRTQMEKSLRESEEKYRTLINSTADGVFVAQDEKFVFSNVSLSAMLGYLPTEFENIPFNKVLAPEHVDLWTDRFYRRITGKKVVSNYQTQFQNKTGTQRIWVELRTNRIEYGGKPAVLGMVRDITEQKKIVEEIENLAKFPAENPGPVLRLDLNGKLLYANEASFALLTEWKLGIGKPAPAVMQKVAALVIESGKDKTIESVHHDRVVTLQFILLEHGSYINVYGRDITEQRQAEETVRALQQFSQATIDALSSHLCVLDENGVIISVNRAWREFADANPPIPLNYGVGANYLTVCENATGEDQKIAHLVAHKLREVLDGRKDQAYFEYACHSPFERRWFYLIARRFEVNGAVRLVLSHENTTRRKEMEQEIMETNQRFTELADHVSDIFWVSEPVTRRNVYVSPAFSKVMGISMEDVENLPNDFLDLVIPEDQHIIIKSRGQEDSGFKTDAEYRIRRPDGMIRWIHDRATPVLDHEGRVVRIVGISSDITERVEAELRLNESETRFRQIANSIPQVFWMYDDTEKRLTYLSPAYETIWGRPVQEMFENDRVYIQAIHPDYLEEMNRAMEKQARGEPSELEYRIIRPDGSIRWINDRSFPIFDEVTGKFVRTAGTATDITEQKLANEALKDSEESLRLSLAAGHQGLYDLNLKTGETIVNREYAEMLGYEPETFVESNEKWLERLHPDDKETTYKAYLDYIHGLTAEYRIEFRQKTKDGKWKWILSTGNIVKYDANGEPVRILGTHTDIDAIKQAESELKKRAAQLALINDVGKKITGVLDIQGVLDLSAQLVHEYFGYHHVGLFTVNDEKSHTIMRAKAGKYAPLFPNAHHIRLGEGIVGTVALNGEMVLTNQAALDLNYVNYFPELLDTVSELGLPIKIAGQVIGVLDVQSPLPNAFTSEDIQVLQTLADQVAIALENARLYESVQTELTERQRLIYNLEMLVEAGHDLSKTLDPTTIYPSIYRYISSVMPCDFIIVSSYDPNSNLIQCEYLYSNEGPQDVSKLPHIPLDPPGRGTQSLVIRSGESLLLSDYEAALKTATSGIYFNERAEVIEENLTEQDHPRSAIIVPLKTSGVVTGVLQVLSSKLNGHTQDHLRFTEALAFHVSAALSNAQLFSELEERVRQRTVEVQDLYDNAPAGYHSLDIQGKFMLINKTELNWLGYTREEMIGRNISNFLTTKSLKTFQETFPIFKHQGFLNNLEMEMLRKDGSVLSVLINAIAVKDEDGNYVMSRSTVFDNTERQKTERALQEREEDYRALFENANDAIFMLEPDGNILGANPRCSDLLRIPHVELIGRNALEFIPRDESGTAASQLNQLLSGEELPIYERTFIRSDGTLVETEVNLSLIRDKTGIVKFIQSVVRDISARKRAEETLRLANAEMQRALRLKDEFLANMSHELRTPLNAILGITESLLEQISGTLNEKQQKYLQTVLESAQHLLELINDILDLAKLNAGRIELDINRVEIQTVAHASLRMVRELAQRKGLNVQLDIDPEIRYAWADERRLKQMLVNLLGNAVKFTPNGGKIGLKIHGNKEEQVLHFTTWDTGIGIKEEDIRHLFQPFVQLDAGLARGSQGTGLGLVLVSQMARLHGGSVSVESKPQKGSRFTISIPWVELEKPVELSKRAALPDLATNEPANISTNNHVILLVEDTEAVTMLISDYLKKHGYKVITARDGFEGIARIQETTPDLIFMDVMMPELDGIETTRRIRQQLGLVHVPIIALTALAMAGDRERCIEAGMNDYLSKPVKLKELLDILEHYLKPNKESSL